MLARSTSPSFALYLTRLLNVCRTGSSCTYNRFKYFTESVGSRPNCEWCPLSNTCYLPSKDNPGVCLDQRRRNASASIGYEYNCPLGPVPYPNTPPTILPHWMGEFYQAGLLDNVRLVDLSLPGTHDSLSYDLSLTVSEDGIDNLTRLAELLHVLSKGSIHLLPGDLEEFFRMQGKTQQLTLSQQLDNGIRFVDLRIMWEHDKSEWFSIHFMQSTHPAEEYLRQIRVWLDEHPHEIVVLWLSKHGSTTATGQHAYPGVSPTQKQQFWRKYTSMFDGLLLQTNESSIFDTPVAQLIERNHRVISFVSDYAEFTQSSTQAMDAAKIENAYDKGEGVFHEGELLQTHIDYFKNATSNNAHNNANKGFTLLGMNTASPSWQIVSAAKRQFLHWMKDLDQPQHLSGGRLGSTDNRKQEQLVPEPSSLWRLARDLKRQVTLWIGGAAENGDFQIAELESAIFHSCASHIKIPGVDGWCPLNLLDIAQLASYYNQIAIEEAYQNSFAKNGKYSDDQVLSSFPNAFYLDGYDYDGTVRTGSQLLDGTVRGETNNTIHDAKYAIVDTILAFNARVACKQKKMLVSVNCNGLLTRILHRRSKYPMQLWNEPNLGRQADWPPYSYEAPIRPEHPGLAKETVIGKPR